MKVLFMKQQHDMIGPKSSYSYSNDMKPLDLLSHFNSKTSLFETLLYYKCDFIIVPTVVDSPWLQTLLKLPGYQSYLESVTENIVNPQNIPFDEYDLVITHDPILQPYITDLKNQFKNTIFSYILVEHSSWQMQMLGFEYDLWLDHTLQSTWNVHRFPQAINYIFPRTPDIVSNIFNQNKDSIFIDYRSYAVFLDNIGKNTPITIDDIESINKNIRLNTDLSIEKISEVSLRPYMFNTNSDDSLEFYKKMNRAKYFVSIDNRVGQASFDAASMGCIVIGNRNSKLHNLVCHKDCMFDYSHFNNQHNSENKLTYNSVIKLINKIESDREYYEEILKYQNDKLNHWGVEYDKKMLNKFIKMKKDTIN